MKNIKYVTIFYFKNDSTKKHKQKSSLDICGRCYRASIVLKTGKWRERIKHNPAFPLGAVPQVNQIDNKGNSLSTEGTQMIKRQMIDQEYHHFTNTCWKKKKRSWQISSIATVISQK